MDVKINIKYIFNDFKRIRNNYYKKNKLITPITCHDTIGSMFTIKILCFCTSVANGIIVTPCPMLLGSKVARFPFWGGPYMCKWGAKMPQRHQSMSPLNAPKGTNIDVFTS